MHRRTFLFLMAIALIPATTLQAARRLTPEATISAASGTLVELAYNTAVYDEGSQCTYHFFGFNRTAGTSQPCFYVSSASSGKGENVCLNENLYGYPITLFPECPARIEVLKLHHARRGMARALTVIAPATHPELP